MPMFREPSQGNRAMGQWRTFSAGMGSACRSEVTARRAGPQAACARAVAESPPRQAAHRLHAHSRDEGHFSGATKPGSIPARHRNIAVDVRHPILLHRDHLLPITTCSAHSTKQAVLFFSFHSNTIRQPLHIFLRPSPRETPARGSTASCCRSLPAPTLPTAVFSPAKPHARLRQNKYPPA